MAIDVDVSDTASDVPPMVGSESGSELVDLDDLLCFYSDFESEEEDTDMSAASVSRAIVLVFTALYRTILDHAFTS